MSPQEMQSAVEAQFAPIGPGATAAIGLGPEFPLSTASPAGEDAPPGEDDPSKLPRDAVPFEDAMAPLPERAPGVLASALIAVAIVAGAGLFGIAISWAMSRVPQDTPQYAYHSGQRR